MGDKKALVLFDYAPPAFKVGGPARSAEGLMYWLKDIGIKDYKILTRNSDIDGTPFTETDTKKYKNTFPIDYFTKNYEIIKYLKGKNYVSITLNSFFSPFFSIIPLIFIKIGFLKAEKIILFPRGELIESALCQKKNKKLIYLFFFKLFLNNIIDTYIATSDLEKKSIISFFGEEVKIKLLTNLRKRNEVSQRKKNNSKTTLAYVCRVSKIKNIEFLIDLLSNLDTDEIECFIIGNIEDQDYYRTLRKKIEKGNLQNIITFTDAVTPEEISLFLDSSDIFISTSKSENYGHSIVEAIEHEIPVIIGKDTPWSHKDIFGVFSVLTWELEDWVKTLRKVINLNSEEREKVNIELRTMNQTNLELESKAAQKYAREMLLIE